MTVQSPLLIPTSKRTCLRVECGQATSDGVSPVVRSPGELATAGSACPFFSLGGQPAFPTDPSSIEAMQRDSTADNEAYGRIDCLRLQQGGEQLGLSKRPGEAVENRSSRSSLVEFIGDHRGDHT